MKERKPNWRDRGACRPVKDFIQLSEERQLEICSGCPLWVRNECLAFALDNEMVSSNPPFGWPVYGGVVATDRQTMLRQRREAQTRRAREAMAAIT